MSDSSRELLIKWLNDALAMEKAREGVLERHARDAESDPEVSRRIRIHRDETRWHAEMVQACIESLDAQVSGVTPVTTLFGGDRDTANGDSPDTMVRNTIVGYAAEHFEIATYRALIDAAEALGEPDVAQSLRPVLRQQQDMANHLESHLAHAVRSCLAAAER